MFYEVENVPVMDEIQFEIDASTYFGMRTSRKGPAKVLGGGTVAWSAVPRQGPGRWCIGLECCSPGYFGACELLCTYASKFFPL